MVLATKELIIQMPNFRVFSLVIVFAASFWITTPANAQIKHRDTGWCPRDKSVQWKVIEYGRNGNEIRYYFRNQTDRDVWVSGYFRYVDSRGKNRTERFKVKVKARTKRGGQWDGFRFYVRPNGNYTVWELKSFQVTRDRP